MNRMRVIAAAVVLSACAVLRSPMQAAIEDGDAARVGVLLDQGADLEGRLGQARETPLMLAASERRYDVARLLLDHGADVDARRAGTSALSEACLAGDKRMVELLLSRGAEVARRDLYWARGPEREAIVALLEKGRAAKARADARAKTAAEPALAPAPGAPASDVDEPSYRLGERPDDFALIVGVGAYMDAPAAPYADRDAAAIRRHLLALGWPARNIVSLTGKEAGRAGLERYLEHWLPNNVGTNSRFVFYFAGGGASDDAGRSYLLPWDGDAAHLEATGYSLERLYRKVAALEARSMLIIVDGPPPDKSDPGACAVLIAPRAALDAQRHGLATYTLLKGLNGEARDSNGFVTLRDLYAYARSKLGPRAPRLLSGGLGEADLRLR